MFPTRQGTWIPNHYVSQPIKVDKNDQNFSLVDGDVSCRGNAALGQRLEDDGGVQPRKTGSTEIRSGVNGAETEFGRFSHRLNREDLLKDKR